MLKPTSSNSTKEHSPRTIHIGTRRSALAVAQTDIVHAALRALHPENSYEIHAMSTTGDKNHSVSLHEFGAKALWTQELETELLAHRLDLVVHCLKDMPTQLPAGCEIGCILKREDPRDALIIKKGRAWTSLADLPAGSVVGTSSVRRSAQIKMRYPHLQFKDIRGSIGTRLSKLDDETSDYEASVLAAAGLLRLGMADRIAQYLDSQTEGGGMLYAVGQGALALEIREGDGEVRSLVSGLEDEDSMLSGLAERSLMRTLEGGCSIPLGVDTQWVGKGELAMKGIVVSLDGTESVLAEVTGAATNAQEADELGWKLAQALVEKGATKVLAGIRLDRSIIEQQGGA